MSQLDFTIFVVCLVTAFICIGCILCIKCKKYKKLETNFNMRIIPINTTMEETTIEDNYEDIIDIRTPVITEDQNV